MNRYLKIGILSICGLWSCSTGFGQFAHELQGPVYPWTGEPQVKGDDFRFVIIGDLTGGEKEGVFTSVIEKINQLAPDFVMCVGDLVDGYTVDPTMMIKQWESFHERIAKLKAPFIYMPGNHDIANKMLFDFWKKQYGHDYYSFTIGHSLFLMINVLKPGEEGISEDQVAYIKKTLLAHGTTDPVYVFSHPPLWDLFDKKGLREIAPMLNSYNTTFFCGDRHHYIHKVMNGRSHYMLAETGMKADNNHLPLGVFNHIFWVTASSKGITIANLLTDGIISPSVVNDQTEKQVNLLLGKNWFKLEPTFILENNTGQFDSRLVISNKGDFPLQVKGGFTNRELFSLKPDSVLLTVAPGELMTIPVSMTNSNQLKIDDFSPVEMNLTGTYFQQGKEIKNSARKSWVIDRLRKCHSQVEKAEEISCNRPGMIEESWSWSGPEDGSFRFSAWCDPKNIHLKINTIDDIVVVDSLNPEHPQDKLFVHFSADTSFQNQGKVIIEMTGGKKAKIVSPSGNLKEKITGRCILQKGKLVANLVIPRVNLKSNFFRLNIGFRDQDDTTSSDQSVLWWKPVWGSESDYPCSGLFKTE